MSDHDGQFMEKEMEIKKYDLREGKSSKSNIENHIRESMPAHLSCREYQAEGMGMGMKETRYNK
jgi:hypothetical protein